MKLLILNWRDITHPEAGGAEINVHEVAKRLVREGCGVYLFCSYYRNAKHHDIIDGIKIIRKGSKFTIYFWAFLYYLFYFKNKTDFVIASHNNFPWLTSFYVRKKNFVLIFHLSNYMEYKELVFPLSYIGYFIEQKLLPLIYRNTRVVTISQNSRYDLIRSGFKSNNIKVIYLGIDLKKYKCGTKFKEPYVIYIGRLKDYKRVDTLINAMPHVLKHFKNIKLSIIGSGDAEYRLKNLVKNLGLVKYIRFHGFVKEEDKISMLQRAHVLINPSSKEGWGLTSIEASACGTIPIASSVSALRESLINGRTGLLFKYGNSEDLAKKIIKVLNDKKLRNYLKKNGLAFAKKFDWNNTTKEYLDFINLLLHK